jgi:DNA-binding transcriptional LysR family regulator
MEKRRAVSALEQGFPRDLDWNLLRTFMVIVEQGGITAAAATLGRKQPTVSNALRRLEDRLGLRLLDRKPTYFRTTPAGERLYNECVDILGIVSRIPSVVSDRGEDLTGHVAIGVASHVISPHLDTLLASFHQEHPKVDFSLSVAESQEVVTSVLRRRTTLGICLVDRKDPRLDQEVFYRQFFGFFCGPNHRLFGRMDLTLGDLEGEDLVSFQTDHQAGALREVAALRAKAGLADRLGGVSSSLQEVRRMIIAGLGIGPLPIHAVRRDVAEGLLWRLPPFEFPPAVDIYVVTNPKARLNRAEAAFVERVRQCLDGVPMEDRVYQ